MAVEDADIMIILKEKSDWVSASNREELSDKMKGKLSAIRGAEFEFTQPIQLRFNELMTGVKTDVAIKIFGDDLHVLNDQAYIVKSLVEDIPGTGDIKVERTEGLPQMLIKYQRDKIALFELDIKELNKIIRTAYAGEIAGIVYEGDKRFELAVRLQGSFRENLDLNTLFVSTPAGTLIPLSEVADLIMSAGPMQITREDAKRRISIGINVRNRDIDSYIKAVQTRLKKDLNLPSGYYINYGGQFENLEAARTRLSIAVPVALLLIFILLYFTFRSLKYAMLIYITVPAAAIGGVLALWVRGMPFSISAGIGFIALFGVAVLNGIVLLSYYNQLRKENQQDLKELIMKGALVRMRPVLLTAAVASFGFLPMALSTTAGAEVQKPLATVVIGGLITSTFLTLIILPTIYYLIEKRKYPGKMPAAAIIIACSLISTYDLSAQTITMDQAVDSALMNNFMIRNAVLEVEAAAFEKKTAVELGLTELNVNYGNINSDDMDYFLELKQNLGNPLQQAKKSKELEAAVGMQSAELDQVRRRVVKETKLNWQKLAYNMDMIKLLEDQLVIFNEYLPYIKLKADEGEISRSEYGLMEIIMSNLENELADSKIDYENALASLKNLTMIRGEIQIQDTSYEILDVDLLNSMNNALLDYYRAKVSYSELAVKTAKAAYFPDLNVGYFNQQIDEIRGFQGVMAAVHFPLWFRPQTKAVQRAKVKYQVSLNEYMFAQRVIDTQYNNWQKKLAEYLRLYNNYGKNWDGQINRLLTSAQYQLSEGELNYINYIQLYMSAMETKRKQLDLIYHINEAIIQLAYFQNL
jgi:cobalt-zinc-cadmium resistance protein CzcA